MKYNTVVYTYLVNTSTGLEYIVLQHKKQSAQVKTTAYSKTR